MYLENDFGFSDINAFLTQNDLWRYVEKHFLPFLIVSKDINEELSSATKLWIESVVRRYPQANVRLISDVKLKKDNRPKWFNGYNKPLIDRVRKFTDAVHKTHGKEEEWSEIL